jgi:3'-phosphoadenosine 5'-phosphosulfate sulfotransferase (PAPS reductase)/FAD synthetase
LIAKLDLSGYKNPALHFSGGKDSLACLYLLKDQLNDLTVYWLNTGDACPETAAIIGEVKKWIPRFVEVGSDVIAWRQANGDPSDLTPAKAHTLGVAYGMNDFRLSNRFDCCYFNLMLPMHRRMLEDGVDAVIRGTKMSDTGAIPAEGKTEFYDVILPIRDWSHEDVFAYLKSVNAPVNPIYEHSGGASAPECLSCTAWWNDGKAEYLKNRHPLKYQEYRLSLKSVRDLIRSHLTDLDAEIGESQ